MTSYSHGLEKIYAFESINPHTVKQASRTAQAVKVETRAVPCAEPFLPLGPEFQEAIPNVRLKEPLTSLGLTPFALKGLLNRNIKSVEEAYYMLQSDPSSYKGLGQGHIEEITEKITAFVGDNPLQAVSFVDWESFVRSLLNEREAKERYIILARHKLQALFQITNSDLQELQRMTDEQIGKSYQKGIDEIKLTKGPFLQEQLQMISDAFIKPYLRRRHGFAKLAEISEHLQDVSFEKAHFSNVYSLLSQLSHPIPLPEVLPGIYAENQESKEDFERVIRCAKEYFYQPFATYPLEMLARLLTQHLARQAVAIQSECINKVLRYCPDFTLQPHARSGLMVSLALTYH